MNIENVNTKQNNWANKINGLSKEVKEINVTFEIGELVNTWAIIATKLGIFKGGGGILP